MTDATYPPVTAHLARTRRDLATAQAAAFGDFGKAVFAEGALSTKTKHIIAVAVAHVTQCPYCIKGHTRAAIKDGATGHELMEAIWVAAEMRAGGAFAHSILAVAEMEASAHGTLGGRSAR
jgi:AhpD family alkylhydroperoxidase